MRRAEVGISLEMTAATTDRPPRVCTQVDHCKTYKALRSAGGIRRPPRSLKNEKYKKNVKRTGVHDWWQVQTGAFDNAESPAVML